MTSHGPPSYVSEIVTRCPNSFRRRAHRSAVIRFPFREPAGAGVQTIMRTLLAVLLLFLVATPATVALQMEIRIDPDLQAKLKGFGVQFFEGDNKWPAIMKALDDVGYAGWGISEQPGGQTKDADSLKDFTRRMDRIFAI